MSRKDPATAVGPSSKNTEVGSVFVSNYPPYSFWSADRGSEAQAALDSPPRPDTPLGLYLHIPFCRKRCKFCYFKVYTQKNSTEIETYLDAVARELEIHAAAPAIAGRPLEFVYVGGGTPSFISARHLRRLVERLRGSLPWDAVREVAFECEPGTLTHQKLEAIREVGVTRLSLGVESFDDAILAENGRAHVSKEIYRVLPWIAELGFDQLNIDLIAGMVGETWDSWRETVRKAVEAAPDSVTVYQMELPFNTVYSGQVLSGSRVPVADWETKRAWHDYAFAQLEQAGYEISSAYTVVRASRGAPFVYRDSVWKGCDLLGIGVSSFSHVNGVHFQNLTGRGPYLARLDEGRTAVDRAYRPAPDELLTRELILQLKLGRLDPLYFRRKFGVEIFEVYAPAFDRLEKRKMLKLEQNQVRLTRQGLLRVDQLLPEFYAPQYQNARYT